MGVKSFEVSIGDRFYAPLESRLNQSPWVVEKIRAATGVISLRCGHLTRIVEWDDLRDNYTKVGSVDLPPAATQEAREADAMYNEAAKALLDTGAERIPRDVLTAPYGTSSTGAMREKMNSVYDLVPFIELTEAYTRVAEFGAKKYAAWNWSKGLPRVQILSSLLRHSFAYLRGEERDKESGLMHTDHILWNAVTLVHNVHWCLEDGRRKEEAREYRDAAKAQHVAIIEKP